MKNYRESDYALNKYSKGIVYKFADGIVEVTLEDFLTSVYEERLQKIAASNGCPLESR